MDPIVKPEDRTAWRKLMETPPVVIDGATFVLIGFLNAIASGIGNDEAAKYLGGGSLFLLRLACAATLQSLLALKMFRSQAYAASVQEKKDEKVKQETGFYTKT